MTQIKLRRDTAANFTSKNPVLGVGEPAYETDTKKLKIGDGTTAYTQLEYFSAGGGGSAPANMVTTDTAQTITGDKTFEGPLTFKGNTNWRGTYNNNCRMNLVDTVGGSASISISNANGNNAEYGVGGGSSYVTYFKPAYNSTKFLLNNYEDGSSENGIAPIVEIAGNLQNRVNSTNYQVLTQNNVTAGDNITITNTTNGISIAAAASSSAPPTQNLKQLDLNYVGTAGTYFYSGWSASSPKHTPISGINDSFFLEIISNNGKGPDNRTLQRLTYNHESSHKGASYFRTGMQGYDSSWTSWVQITPAITS